MNERKIEILIALLSEVGYSGYEYGEQYLRAYILAANYNKSILEPLCSQQHVNYTYTIIENKNWNSEWEKILNQL